MHSYRILAQEFLILRGDEGGELPGPWHAFSRPGAQEAREKSMDDCHPGASEKDYSLLGVEALPRESSHE